MESKNKSKSGLPPPANIHDIIQTLFNNVIAKSKCSNTVVTFSRVKLTREQKKRVTIPEGFSFIGLFLVFQSDIIADGHVESSDLQLISFLNKDTTDDYIYGYYSHIIGQPRFCIDSLNKGRDAIKLNEIVTFVARQYIEVYNDVNGTSIVQGFNTSEISAPFASLQFPKGRTYFYQNYGANGIINPNDPPFKIIGLSQNLKHI